MRFIGTTKSRVDKDIDVYQVAIGSQEVRLITAALINAHRNLPQLFENTPQRHRIKNIIRCLEKITKNYNLKKPQEYDKLSE